MVRQKLYISVTLTEVRDSLEESIVDAVRTEIDAVDFKVTVER